MEAVSRYNDPKVQVGENYSAAAAGGAAAAYYCSLSLHRKIVYYRYKSGNETRKRNNLQDVSCSCHEM